MRTRTLAVLVLALSAGCTLKAPEPASPAKPAKKYEPPDERFVFFNGSKADVLADGFFSIGYVTALLDADPAFKVLVVGHADPHGKPDANRDISFKRARAVRKVLAEHGITEARIQVAVPREQTESSLSQLARRADLFVYDPAHEDASKRVGYPVDIQNQ